jgi:hypothetical protein
MTRDLCALCPETKHCRAHHIDPEQSISWSKEPSVVPGSQPPRNIAAREAAHRYKSALLVNFLRSEKAGPLPDRLFERWRPRDQAAAAQRFGGCRTRGRCCRASKRSRHRPASAGRGDGAAVAPSDLRNLERLPAGSPRTRTIARAWPPFVHLEDRIR